MSSTNATLVCGLLGFLVLSCTVMIIGLARQGVSRRRAMGMPVLPGDDELQQTARKLPYGIGSSLVQTAAVAVLIVATVVVQHASAWLLVIVAGMTLSALVNRWRARRQ